MTQDTPTPPPPATLSRPEMERWVEEVHDAVTHFFLEADGGDTAFREDAWDRPGGGGGVARVLQEGEVFEKAGVNRSVVEGELKPEVAVRLGGQVERGGPLHFLAGGVSVVAHPRSPMVPIVHLNVRYFEISNGEGKVVDAWFGGGTDLTPTHPFPEDAVHFHRTLRELCRRHHPEFYPRYKAWCDDYFVNTHRGGERRGVGGIFFDHLRPHEVGLDTPAVLEFVTQVGTILPAAYGPLVERRRSLPWGDREKALQLFRRGRYVEFNLVHDRGTVFGLRTEARVESVLMSLPPLAAWRYDPSWEEGSMEARLMEMLIPQEWVPEE